jgi:hypothetical protein
MSQYKLSSSTIFLNSLLILSLSSPSTILRTFFKQPQSVIFFSIKNKSSHPCKTTLKAIPSCNIILRIFDGSQTDTRYWME